MSDIGARSGGLRGRGCRPRPTRGVEPSRVGLCFFFLLVEARGELDRWRVWGMASAGEATTENNAVSITAIVNDLEIILKNNLAAED